MSWFVSLIICTVAGLGVISAVYIADIFKKKKEKKSLWNSPEQNVLLFYDDFGTDLFREGYTLIGLTTVTFISHVNVVPFAAATLAALYDRVG